MAALRGKGHQCVPQEAEAVRCALEIGESAFEVTLRVPGGRLSSVFASVRTPGPVDGSPAAMAYLSWLAELPFAGDRAVVAEVHRWVLVGVTAQKGRTGRISGYRYTLDSGRRAGHVTLSIDPFTT
ncbi:hypothetical protein D5H75_33230 [Bailinhaonella thermotolerans]|uniref:Uncharacterized protein n=1 Tax=Bailinhaonella thermotolerans TaxID=1070861 RepID=A0A3A4A423_9ACTN|nr:hypothetical protein D5H75_33230 [Bailinhaonella thermotolerans]